MKRVVVSAERLPPKPETLICEGLSIVSVKRFRRIVAAPYVDKESDWETLSHNPLVQKNKVTGRHRTIDLATIANLRKPK